SYEKIDAQAYRVEINWNLLKQTDLNKLFVSVEPAFKPIFHWAPHLTPTDNHIIAQHAFRWAAVIVHDEHKLVSIIPDVSLWEQKPLIPWSLDMDAHKNILTLGQANAKITEHILYEREDLTRFPKGRYNLAFYLVVSTDSGANQNPFAKVNSFMWQKWGAPLYAKGEPLPQ